MSCEDDHALLSAQLDGELSAEEQEALDAHLRECQECRAYKSALEEISVLLRRDLPTPDERLCPSIMEKLRAQSAPRPVRRFPLRSLSLAASLLLLVGLGVFAGRSLSPAKASQNAAESGVEEPMLMRTAADCAGEESASDESAAPAEGAPAQGVYAAPQMEAATTESVAEDSGEVMNALDLPLPRQAAETWLLENGKTGFAVTDVEPLEEIPPYEGCLDNYSPVGESALVRCVSTQGETLLLLVDESGTVYGTVVE